MSESQLSVIPSESTETAPVTALSLVDNTALGMVKVKEFTKKTKTTLVRYTFLAWLKFKFNLADDDREGIKAARKTTDINKMYRTYCNEIDVAIAVARARATEDGKLKIRAVEVGVCNDTGETLDYVEKYGEVKVPKGRKTSATKVVELEAKVAELVKQLAASNTLDISE